MKKSGKWVVKTVPLNTNNITTGIINFLESEGHVAMRINTQGQFEQITPASYNYKQLISTIEIAKMYGYVVGKWRKSNSTEGVSDVLCCLKGGKFLAVEVKFGKDRLSPAQSELLNKIFVLGGEYCIAKSLEDFIKYYEQTIKPLL